ncbi:early nodulin-like protein 18 [Rutidosis leptorrhynchoides]|uniref:early nodulin-like protein 18 n=1 Tax=Rutidosis leptorrhynchoides TaxID=125765 RepID=UPI003A99ED59
MAPALHLTLITLFITTTTAAAYTNHTVGGRDGWFFNPQTNKSATNYASWTADQTFNLGDYLIFNTNTNQTVVLTYNETTFRSCSIDNSSDSDTFQFVGQQGGEIGAPLTVPVPLTIVGPNYFFSDAFDGIQCENGLAFGINVSHGVGLPPNLNQPPPPPYVEPPSNADGSLTPPVTGNQPNGAGLYVGANVRGSVYGALITFYGIFALI